MKTVTWIVWGLGLNIAAAALHGESAPEAIMATGVDGTLPKLVLVIAGNVCLWRGFRSALGDLWGGLTGRSIRENGGRSRLPDNADPVSDFDADEAFARYMQQRAAASTLTETERQAVPAPRAPARPAVPGGFGRRVI
jgi:hypothetical protein